MKILQRIVIHMVLTFSLISFVSHSENRIDVQRPDAPELAAYGKYDVGVRTFEMINPEQIDMLKVANAKSKPSPYPTYDRSLTVEVWYPAQKGTKGETDLRVYLRDGKTQVRVRGKAVRDAKAVDPSSPFPLVIISHGYPGNRFLMAHLAENIASKGYIVASIDHLESTYRTQAAFSSTLINRPLDQTFVLNQIEALSKQEGTFFHRRVNTQQTGLIGYSMGGYGAVVMAGGGLTQQAVDSPQGAPYKLLKMHQSGSESQQQRPDPRLKTVIAFAPWGMNYGMWNADTLKHITIPMLYIAGSDDDISGYENGVKALWQNSTGTERSLLTFENANHNAGAPMPAPEESFVVDDKLGSDVSGHYTDAVWDNVRMNNISQHFVTAWLGYHLKSDKGMQKYLDLTPKSNNGVWAKSGDGIAKPEHTYWHGFAKRTAKGLMLETLQAGE